MENVPERQKGNRQPAGGSRGRDAGDGNRIDRSVSWSKSVGGSKKISMNSKAISYDTYDTVPRHVVIAVVKVKLQLPTRLLHLLAPQITTVPLKLQRLGLLQLKNLNAEVSWIILVHVQNGLLMGTAMTQFWAGRNS